MTISTTEPRITYAGDDSTTVFAIPFDFLDSSEIDVTLITDSTHDAILKTLTTDYTISGSNLTMLTAPASGETLVITLDVAESQSTDYISNDAFPAETHEAALDKLTRLVKQIKATLDYRVPKLPENILTSTTTTDTDLEANAVFKINSSATGIELGSVTTSDIILDTGTNTSGLDTAGEVMLDTDGDGSTVQQGVIAAYDGSQIMNYFGSTGYPSTDDQVLAYDAGTNSVTWQTLVTPGGLGAIVDDTTPQLGGQLDINGNAIGDGTRELLTFTEDASAVNHVNIENEATGSGPIIASAGDDTNIDLNLTPKGSGDLYVNADTLYIEQDIAHIGDTNNLIQFGTDTQDFQTGGSSRLDISDSGVRLGAANARVTTVLDEDTMSSDSATALATQQSIKAYVDSAASGLTLLATVSASASSTVDFDNYLDSTYETYLLTFSAVIPGTDGALLHMRAGTGATPTYQSGASDYAWCYHYVSTGAAVHSDTADSEIEIIGSTNSIGSGATEGACGHVWIHSPANSSTATWCKYHTAFYRSTDNLPVSGDGQGRYTAATAVTSIRFLMSSGTVSSGEFKLYGLVKS